jgi:RimJ/RimL family protein N-acetyltransferase
MRLRKLKETDAPLMLEWMHDDSVVHELATDFSSKTIEDCEQFIKASRDTSSDIHMAIVSDTDEYMGTASLKYMDHEKGTAEFAIIVRKEAMGKGYSWFGMTEMLKLGFEQMSLNAIYWCVSEKNKRACRFYDKHGFHTILDVPEEISVRNMHQQHLRWYVVLPGDDYENVALSKGKVSGCKIINIRTIPTVNAGELSFFEGNNHDIGFDIKRIYYISKVPEGIWRGFHAHKKLQQLLFCPYGKIQLILENEMGREEITLSDPSIGVIIDKPTWREMLWLENNSVLCVAASDYYDPDDYIRDYNEFKTFIDS